MSEVISADSHTLGKDQPTEPGQYLDGLVTVYGVAWVIGTAIASSLKLSEGLGVNPARGKADMYYLVAGVGFAAAAIGFFFVYSANEQGPKRSVAKAMTLICSIIALTFGILLPNRLTIVLSDINGNPVDLANHFEQFICSSLLIHIMGEICNSHGLANKMAFWNYGVIAFGYIASITKNPYSALFAWFAVGCYSPFLVALGVMFNAAARGNFRAHVSGGLLWAIKHLVYAGNHAITLVWFLSRTRLLAFDESEKYLLWGHFFCKIVFGTLALAGLSGAPASLKKVE